MKLTLYYLTRTVKNQIRKICRTWVAVFLLVCILGGALIGIGVGVIADLAEKNEEPTEDTDTPVEELPPEEEISFSFDTAVPEERIGQVMVELVVGGIVLLVLTFAVLTADKSGSAIFLMADVNLLFPAPMRPQTILLFRYLMRTGSTIVATLYLLFQVPNITRGLGYSAAVGFAMIGAWLLLLIYSKLVSVLLFTLASTHPNFKKRMRTGWFLLLALIVGSFFLYIQQADADVFAAADRFFNAPAARIIPVWGWLKAMVIGAVTGRPALALGGLGALLLLAVVLAFIVWHLKADFYEEAMAKSAEIAEMQRTAAESGKMVVAGKRKKDRAERLWRDRMTRGAGASVYFFKAMYNRFRFAHLHVFTKTSEFYMLVALLLSAFLRFVLVTETFAFPIVALVLAVIVFYRSLGNPIATDISQEGFCLIPDTAHRKVFFSFAAGVLNSAMDLLPAFLLGALLLLPNPATVFLWFLLVVSLGTYSDSMGMFIDLSLPTSLTPTVRSMVQLLFIYFGLIPSVALMAVGFAIGHVYLFAVITVIFDLAITALSLTISPMFLNRGRK